MCQDPPSNVSSTPASPSNRRASLRRILPCLLLLAFAAFREFNSAPIDEGPRSSTPARREANLRRGGCSDFYTSSAGEFWRDIRFPVVLNSTYLPSNGDRADSNAADEDDAVVRENMMRWTRHLMEFHTAERLRRALSNRPSGSSLLRILSIVSRYRATKVPLKILVTGGSVAAGHWCVDNPAGWDGGRGGAPFKDCAWPSRFERHLRRIFFGDEAVPGIIVYNMAVGATSVDVAAMILEYELLPEELLSPDVVLLAHAPNDANMLNPDSLFYTHINNAVQAAKRLRACDDDLPLVGIIDDNVGMQNISQAMETAARYYAASSWYGLMMINYGNVARHTLLRRYDENRLEPLLGGKFQVHGGMGFHISLAWTVTFCFMWLMMDACYDHEERDSPPPITSKEWKHEAALDNLMDLPWGTSPSKQLGGVYRSSDPASVNQEWLNNLQTNEEHCKSFNASAPLEPACTYAWMVNKLSGIMRPKDIHRAIKPVMRSSHGWEATGHFYNFPRLGYYANAENANFYLEIPVTAPTVYFTVLSTESYGPNFVDTNLQIDVRIDPGDFPTTYDILGYHEEKSSPLVSHKFKLPRVANRGETIYFNATLTGGAYFRIAGLSFCKQ